MPVRIGFDSSAFLPPAFVGVHSIGARHKVFAHGTRPPCNKPDRSDSPVPIFHRDHEGYSKWRDCSGYGILAFIFKKNIKF